MSTELPRAGAFPQTEFPISSIEERASATGSGPGVRVQRPGSRWGFRIRVAARTAQEALEWKVLHKRGELFVWTLCQPGVSIGSPGSPRVSGAAQAGTSLSIDGLSAGYAFQVGQWITVITAGQRYAYMVQAAATADGTGAATVQIEPELRVTPADNDVIEVASPKVEGYVAVPQNGFDLSPGAVMRGLTFTLKERR